MQRKRTKKLINRNKKEAGQGLKIQSDHKLKGVKSNFCA